MTKVRKAVIAAAGFGTRFLPQTKAMPKEMLPLIDKPIIQYIVEEMVEAGIEDIIIVTGYHKRSIEDHFDHISADLRANLKQGKKLDLLEETKKISNLANFAYVRQKGPYGNATPVMNVEHLIGDEPFLYVFADDFFVATPSRFQQMINLHEKSGKSVVACKKVHTDDEYSRYGIVAGDELEPGTLNMKTIVEKPGKKRAPSDMASVGGYLFTPSIFKYIRDALRNLADGKEFYIQPAMQNLIDHDSGMLAYQIKDAKYYDTGNKLDYLKTVVDFGLQHPELKDEFRKYLRGITY
ncbi:MAG: UTP--glucose-1-phosphate uridylyltransferase [bacterium]|nr:UTP--glucose-1-phosphate uridylyltransferase [bacterium]